MCIYIYIYIRIHTCIHMNLPTRDSTLRLAGENLCYFVAEVLRRIAEICGDCKFPLQNDQQVLRIFTETTNPRKSCAETCQEPGSRNSRTPLPLPGLDPGLRPSAPHPGMDRAFEEAIFSQYISTTRFLRCLLFAISQTLPICDINILRYQRNNVSNTSACQLGAASGNC